MNADERIVSTSLENEELIRFGLISAQPEWSNDHKLEGYIESKGFKLHTVNGSALFKLVSELSAKKAVQAHLRTYYGF